MFSGTIIHAKGVGKTLGFPTANLDCVKKDIKLASGVYATWVAIGSETYMGALVVMDEPWKIEVHLLDYSGKDIYGRTLILDPIQKVSEVETYGSATELVKKIQDDLVMVRDVLTGGLGK